MTLVDPRIKLGYNLKHRYGLPVDEFHKMVTEQTGRCAICEEPTPNLVVDHSHITGEVGKLLCSNCNTAIGLMKHNPTVVASALSYVETYHLED